MITLVKVSFINEKVYYKKLKLVHTARTMLQTSTIYIKMMTMMLMLFLPLKVLLKKK